MTPDPHTTAAISQTFDQITARLTQAKRRGLGFPAASDLDYAPAMSRFLSHMVNNLGDPGTDGAYPFHTKDLERDVIAMTADLLRAPADDRWGYVTSGSTEAIEHALYLARRRYPHALVYASRATHHAVTNAVDRLRMELITVRTHASGEIDCDDLHGLLRQYRHRPAIIVANVGSALTEAVDDVTHITSICDDLAIQRRWIHADAALTGIPLALLPPGQRPGFDLADGAHSANVSGHKFLGTPVPCGLLIMRDSLRRHAARTYTGSPDTTLTNSRSGLAAACLWYALTLHGTDGLRARAEAARATAVYAHGQLVQLGRAAERQPWAFTVAFDHPGDPVAGRWGLPRHGPPNAARTHLITMPGVTREHVDLLVGELCQDGPATTGGGTLPAPAAAPAPTVPAQRSNGHARTPILSAALSAAPVVAVQPRHVGTEATSWRPA